MSEYLIEFVRVGQNVKVTAVDPLTGTEASVMGAVRTSTEELKRLAVKKLLYVMRKQSGSKEEPAKPPEEDNLY